MKSEYQTAEMTGVAQTAALQLESLLISRVSEIESWFRDAFKITPAPIMSSVDLRHAGFKLAPVDTNLFPAGFNNLNPDVLPMCIQALQSVMTQLQPPCRRILLVPEAHTRNTYYLQSLKVLQSIFVKAGFEVVLGHWEPPLLENGQLAFERIERKGDYLFVGGVAPCAIVLNNDLSSGIPELFLDLQQPIYPKPELGWTHRKKSHHFELYHEVVNSFSELLQCDPWLFYPEMDVVDDVNFVDKTGLSQLAEAVELVLDKVRRNYAEHEIKETPFVVVKADNGTYGMSVMMVHSGENILQLNRKQRIKMATSKGGMEVHRVLVQEGVYSVEAMPGGATAEPVVYMIGPHVVGGFYRVHQGRGKAENLNAPGMYFEPIPFTGPCNTPCCELPPSAIENRFYLYGVIARLAALAAGKESLG